LPRDASKTVGAAPGHLGLVNPARYQGADSLKRKKTKKCSCYIPGFKNNSRDYRRDISAILNGILDVLLLYAETRQSVTRGAIFFLFFLLSALSP
jgi:hypothetical protein